MRKIPITTETLPTMGGVVTYHTMTCPSSQKGMFGSGLAKVGSTSCQMCPHFGGIEKVQSPSITYEQVICNHV